MKKLSTGIVLLALSACGTSNKKTENVTPVAETTPEVKFAEEGKPAETKTPETKTPETKPTDDTRTPDPKTPDINSTLKQLVGTWYACREVSFSPAVPAAAGIFVFHADGTFEEYDRAFSDKDCTKPVTTEQAIAAGLGADFNNQWNENYSGKFTIAATATAGVFNIDSSYDDEVEPFSSYRIFKIEDSKLMIANIQNCSAPDSDRCKNIGTTAANRPTDFGTTVTYSKR